MMAGMLRRLREQLLLMGAKVEEMIRGSIRALVERDTGLAEQMIAFDKKINQLELEIDELCMQVLARRQPVASDLRFITMALKLVTDLERIGDLGVNISERVVELNEKALANGKKAGAAALETYEKAVVSFTESYEKAAGATKVDWIVTTATAQADLTRELVKAYTTAARELVS